MTTNNETSEQEKENDLTEQQDMIEGTATVIEDSNPPKKTSSGVAWLGILLSLAALAVSAYTLYFYHLKNTPQQTPDFSADFNNVNTQIEANQTSLQQQAASISSLEQQLSQLQSQIERLTDADIETEPSEAVDLSPVQQQLDELQQQIAEITQTQTQLQTAVQSALNQEQTPAIQTPQVSVAEFRNAVVKLDALEQQLQNNLLLQQQASTSNGETPETQPSILPYTINKQLALAELYLNLDLPQAAVESLNTVINNESRTAYPGFVGQMERAVQQINNTAAIDSAALQNQLQQLDTAIQDLQLNTQETEITDGSWYDKFITIRKVDNTAAVQSSTELSLLKSALQHQVMLAQLALQTKNQSQWTAHLADALEGIRSHFPEQTALIEQIESLQQQQIQPTYPPLGLLIDSFQQIQSATAGS